MGLLTNLIISLIHLALIGADIMFFFLLVRILWSRYRFTWLQALDAVGRPIVEWFTGCIEEGIGRISKRTFSQSSLLFIGMLVLTFVRFALAGLFSK